MSLASADVRTNGQFNPDSRDQFFELYSSHPSIQINLRDFCKSPVDLQSNTPANPHHFVRPGRGSPDPQYGIALLKQSNGDGMKDFIEGFVADLPRTS